MDSVLATNPLLCCLILPSTLPQTQTSVFTFDVRTMPGSAHSCYVLILLKLSRSSNRPTFARVSVPIYTVYCKMASKGSSHLEHDLWVYKALVSHTTELPTTSIGFLQKPPSVSIFLMSCSHCFKSITFSIENQAFLDAMHAKTWLYRSLHSAHKAYGLYTMSYLIEKKAWSRGYRHALASSNRHSIAAVKSGSAYTKNPNAACR